MRKLPGAPELAGPGYRQPITDAIAIYRARHAGHGGLDFARFFVAAPGYRWRTFVLPDVSNRSLAARATFEDQVSLAPGSFLISIASSSGAAAGFQFSIVDAGSKQPLSSDMARAGALSGRAATFANRGGPFFLPVPWVVSKPGLVLVKLANLAAAANEIDLQLQFAEPV